MNDITYKNWIFSIREVSNNVYNVIAENNNGNKIDVTGFDIEKLIKECEKWIDENVDPKWWLP